MSEDVLQAAGVRPEEESAMELMLQKPQGEAVLLTCTADEDMVDAHTLGALTSTGKLGPHFALLLPATNCALLLALGPLELSCKPGPPMLDAVPRGCHGAASLDP